MVNKVLKIGHRGAMGYCEENTLFCFEKAIELGVDMVELDVHIFNNEIIVAHDSPQESGEYPTLKSVIDLVDRRVIMNIELKSEATAKPVAKLLKECIKKGWGKDKFLISSFNINELREFKKQGLGIKIGLIIEKKNTALEDIGFYSIHPSLKIVNKKMVDDLHNQGFKVFVWTVNKKRDIEKMISLGADGIFSDYPDRL